ncbi:MAG: helix-turn-helix transcriptional regulator [Candidatus Nitrotoga sp.]|nr:helix-turn-helix transcriptional regulator [Candidatus Nitrotoga sp.]MDW7604397.1 helix-turn-helix transcriptional regulator [Candidatus Nitrotoga sp.]MDW7625799.1 helix-turn-helix transcriptional regulator [Candidatus Nitrotoga sp.]
MNNINLDLRSLGVTFRRERLAIGLTQAEVAKKAGLRRETIIQLESGASISATTLIQAVAALGKALAIVDRKLDYDRLDEVFSEDP